MKRLHLMIQGHPWERYVAEMATACLPEIQICHVTGDPGCDAGSFLCSVFDSGRDMATAEYRDTTGIVFRAQAQSADYPGQDVPARLAVKAAVCKVLLGDKPPMPWGLLTGVRPVKLLRELRKKTGNVSAAAAVYQEVYQVSEEKTSMAVQVLKAQDPLFSLRREKEVGVYISIPFCMSHCTYCSFPGETGFRRDDVDIYLDCIEEEMAMTGAVLRRAGYRTGMIYVGGGTPGILEPDQLERLFNAVGSYLVAKGHPLREFTTEAGRPDTITAEKLRVMKNAGVTRVSVNPQTIHDATLRRVGRNHTWQDVQEAVRLVRNSGIGVLNMDLIAALPGECGSDFLESVRGVAALRPENITLHTLAAKRGAEIKKQTVPEMIPSAFSFSAALPEAYQYLQSLGYQPYYLYRQKHARDTLENTGYTLPGAASPYNVMMMEDACCILGIGAGAATRWKMPGGRICRFDDVRSISHYMESHQGQLSRKLAFLKDAAGVPPQDQFRGPCRRDPQPEDPEQT